jgi:hypothetical protein
LLSVAPRLDVRGHAHEFDTVLFTDKISIEVLAITAGILDGNISRMRVLYAH